MGPADVPRATAELKSSAVLARVAECSTPNKHQGVTDATERESCSVCAKMASAPAVKAQGVYDEGVCADLLQRTKRIRPGERWEPWGSVPDGRCTGSLKETEASIGV